MCLLGDTVNSSSVHVLC